METPGSKQVNERASSVRYYGFIGLMACFVLGILISTFYTLHRLREDAIKSHFDIGAMYVRTFEDHLTQSCNFIDRTLVGMIDEISSGKPPEQLRKAFTVSLRQMPSLRSLSLLDNNGNIFVSSNPLNLGKHVAGNYLPAITETAGVLRIGKPWSGRDFADGHERSDSTPVTPDDLGFIPLMRMFDHNGGTYALIATLNPDYFMNYYRQMLGYPEDQVELVRYDGEVLLYTGDRATLGDNARNRPFIAKLGEKEFGELVGAEPGRPQCLISYRTSRFFPLVLISRIDRNRALEQWEEEKLRLLAVVIPSLCLIVAASLMLYRRQQLAQAERLETERREYEKFAATVFAAVAEAVMATDAESRIVLVNPALLRATGYTENELIGQTPAIFSSGLHEPAFYRQMWDALKQSGYWEGELQNHHKDGRPWIVWTSISRVCNADGGVTHYVAAYSDVTERKQMEESLRFAKEEANSANRAKSQFLANMSHELRNPMNGVVGMIQLLERTELTEEQREFVVALNLSGKILISIISDILDLSKIEAGKITIEPTEFSLRHCINDVALMQKQVIHEKGIKLDLEVDEGIPQFVRGDQLRVKQVLHNLMGNAVKFTSQGSITVSAQILKRQDASLLVQLAVCDTGIGISPQALDKIFNPFEQEDGSTTRNYGGTGLGLTISRRLAELMSGSITVESTPGEGSCFKVILPFGVVEEISATKDAPQKTGVSWDGSPLRILLVEDDRINILVGTSLLKKLGFGVTVAQNGRECLAALKEDTFDLVLMDINMPVMNGSEALLEIRRNEQDTDLHQMVIALTAYSLRDDKDKFLNEGFDGYISKPMASSELVREMKRVLKQEN